VPSGVIDHPLQTQPGRLLAVGGSVGGRAGLAQPGDQRIAGRFQLADVGDVRDRLADWRRRLLQAELLRIGGELGLEASDLGPQRPSRR
jgi:hypothetical protein